MTADELEEETSKLYFILIVVILIMAGSLIYELYSFTIALIISLLMWLLYGGVARSLIQTMEQRKSWMEKNNPLLKFCISCGSEIGVEDKECMYCNEIVVET